MITFLIILATVSIAALAFCLGVIAAKDPVEPEPAPQKTTLGIIPFLEQCFSEEQDRIGWAENDEHWPTPYEIYDVHRFHKAVEGDVLEDWLRINGFLK